MLLVLVTCPFPNRSFDRGGVNVGEWDGPFSLLYSMHYSLLGCTNWTAIWISRNKKKKKKEVLPDAVVLLGCETVGYILKALLPVTSAGRLKWTWGRQTGVWRMSPTCLQLSPDVSRLLLCRAALGLSSAISYFRRRCRSTFWEITLFSSFLKWCEKIYTMCVCYLNVKLETAAPSLDGSLSS